ncbi:MAG: hypothetical protein Q4G19_06150 [Clostridia bacterium]|nr:hypothetical protein [Clostridia bacterium]
MTKRMIAFLTALILLLAALPAAAEPVLYQYGIDVGDFAEGDGMRIVHELADALTVNLTRENGVTEDRYLLELMSNGRQAVTLTAVDSASEGYALQCSLTGDHVFMCRKDRIVEFLQTLVEALTEMRILKSDGLETMKAMAAKVGGMLEEMTAQTEKGRETGIDFVKYVKRLTDMATEAGVDTNDTAVPDEEAPAGTAVCRRYMLSENNLRNVTEKVVDRIENLPVIGNEFKAGHLGIGKTPVTGDLLRDIASSLKGETALTLYENDDGKLLMLKLMIPSLAGIGKVAGTPFEMLTGAGISIERHTENEAEISDTTVVLTGMDIRLGTVRMRKAAGKHVPDLSKRHVHQVGEMNSADLAELIKSMKWTIIGNAIGALWVLPGCVFDMVLGALF